MITRLLCLLFGHKWFDTVLTDVRSVDVRHNTWLLTRYSEAICLRCQVDKVAHVESLDRFDPCCGCEDPPTWMEWAPLTTALPDK